MDGIFGVGLPEMVIVLLALFVVGGPKNTAKWAREMGVWVRKGRLAWAQMLAEMENELGPEGKEVMDVARELGKGVNDVRGMNPTRRAMNETIKMVGDAIDVKDDELKVETKKQPALPAKTSSTPLDVWSSSATGSNGTTEGSANGSSAAGDSKYSAWLPPESSE